MSTPVVSKSSAAFYAQAVISFGVAIFAVLVGIYFLPVSGWVRAFLALGALFLTTSTFTLAKVVRDRQESEAVYARLDEARVDKLLAEHDPFRLRSSGGQQAQPNQPMQQAQPTNAGPASPPQAYPR